MGKVLSWETAARASVAKLASQKEQIQELLRDEKKITIVDEAEVGKQKYINVLVGTLIYCIKGVIPFFADACQLRCALTT